MNKNELKKTLKPLIKECIKEVMFEDGTLSTIISEVMKGTGASQPIVERKQRKQSKKPVQQFETDEQARQRRNKLMESIGADSYNGVNLFEGTTPAPAPSNNDGQGALSGVSSNDSGVDISGLMNKTTAIWQKMNEK